MNRGSVGGAADAMGVTQSAASKQLAQLREWFDDPLFVRTRDGMQPTPRAAELSGLVGSILEHAAALTSSDRVSPDAFTGRFVLSATDEVLERVLPALVRRLSVEAPRMTLVTLPVARDYSIRQLEAGQVNLLLAVNWHAPDQLLQRKLDSDPFVCVMHQNHPLAGVKLTRKRYAQASHVLVAPLGYEAGVVDAELDRLGLSRFVCASVSSFHLLSEAVLGESRVTTVPSRVARRLVNDGPFVTRRVPLSLPETVYYALWHPRFAAEPRLRWVLDAVIDAFNE